MRCVIHPNAIIEWQEVVETKNHPLLGDLVKITKDIPYCPKCFEEYTETGTYNSKLEMCEQDYLESQVDNYIENYRSK